jgi:hypothetical protein
MWLLNHHRGIRCLTMIVAHSDGCLEASDLERSTTGRNLSNFGNSVAQQMRVLEMYCAHADRDSMHSE